LRQRPCTTIRTAILRPLVKAQKSSVVNISTRQVIKVKQPSPFGDPQMDQFFYRFFGGQVPQKEQVRQSLAPASSSAPTAIS